MATFDLLELLNNIEGQIDIDGIAYKFYNNGTHHGTYKKYPIPNNDRSVDGSWHIDITETGYELVTTPVISKERLFLSVALIPESALKNIIPLSKVLKP